jgi:effector-binding domain-containing protein
MLRQAMSTAPRRFSVARHHRWELAAAVLVFSLLATPAIAQVPAPPATQEAVPAPNTDAFGEEVTLTGRPIVFIAGKATWDNTFPTLREKFKAISAFLDKQKLNPSGSSMTIYTAMQDKGFDYQAAVPLAEQPANLPRGTVTAGQSPVGKALKFVHRGSYDSMESLYEAITNYLDEKHLDAQGLIVEEYVTNPVTTSSEQLVVNVFVLLK